MSANKGLPDGIRRCRMYVGKGCFAGYNALVSLSFTYLGPANFMVLKAEREPSEWTKLAELYQTEGLGPGGDPFASLHRPPSAAHRIYRIRLRRVERYPFDIVLYCRLEGSVPSERTGDWSWMFYFYEGSLIAHDGEHTVVVGPNMRDR